MEKMQQSLKALTQGILHSCHLQRAPQLQQAPQQTPTLPPHPRLQKHSRKPKLKEAVARHACQNLTCFGSANATC